MSHHVPLTCREVCVSQRIRLRQHRTMQSSSLRPAACAQFHPSDSADPLSGALSSGVDICVVCCSQCFCLWVPPSSEPSLPSPSLWHNRSHFYTRLLPHTLAALSVPPPLSVSYLLSHSLGAPSTHWLRFGGGGVGYIPPGAGHELHWDWTHLQCKDHKQEDSEAGSRSTNITLELRKTKQPRTQFLIHFYGLSASLELRNNSIRLYAIFLRK